MKRPQEVLTFSKEPYGNYYGPYGLFYYVEKHAYEMLAEFNNVIPLEFSLGEAKGKGDCLFDSCARYLNARLGREEYNAKQLRLLCAEYAQELYGTANDWIAKEFKTFEEHLNYLGNIEYTADEQKFRTGDEGTWGEPKIDGRIICEKFGIKLHIIEVQDAHNQFIVSHDYVDAKGIRRHIDQSSIDWSDESLCHIGVCNNHYVPILKNTIVLKPRRGSCDYEAFYSPESPRIPSPPVELLEFDFMQGQLIVGAFSPPVALMELMPESPRIVRASSPPATPNELMTSEVSKPDSPTIVRASPQTATTVLWTDSPIVRNSPAPATPKVQYTSGVMFPDSDEEAGTDNLFKF